MLKKLLSLVLIGVLINLVEAVPAYANSKGDAEPRDVKKVKEGILRLGTGEMARIKVKLRDGTKFAGYIREADESGFVVVDQKTGAATTIPYPQVKQVKGNNLSKGVRTAIIVGAFVGFLLVLSIVIGRG